MIYQFSLPRFASVCCSTQSLFFAIDPSPNKHDAKKHNKSFFRMKLGAAWLVCVNLADMQVPMGWVLEHTLGLYLFASQHVLPKRAAVTILSTLLLICQAVCV